MKFCTHFEVFCTPVIKILSLLYCLPSKLEFNEKFDRKVELVYGGDCLCILTINY